MSLVQGSPTFFVAIDASGKTLLMNKAMLNVLGYTINEVVGRDYISNFVPEADHGKTLQIFEKLVKFNEPSVNENRVLTRDGKELLVEWYGRPAIKENGDFDYFFGIGIDITERKRAEEALREASAYTRGLIEASLDPLVTISPDGKIMDVNHSTELVTGFSREKLIGSDFSEYFTEPEKAREGYKEVFSKEFVKDYPLAIRHISGKITDVLYNAAVYRNESGEVQGVFAAARDITGRKRAEEEIRRLNAELERRVIERTAQLEAANRELEAFSYSVSHDLRAPLRSIDGFSQALLEDYSEKLDDQGKDHIARVRAASQRMSQLIDDMLMLSRVTRREMKYDTVDLSALAKTIAAELKKTQPDRQVEFIIEPGLAVNGDTELLRAMLENLLGNAWKFTSKHKRGRIEFGITEHEGKPAYFVHDDGVGFEMAYADKLFKAFQRLHSPTEFPGTGIGLATVKRIIHRHGGEVWAKGEAGKGATFYFNL